MRIANKISFFVIPLAVVPLLIIGYFSYNSLTEGFKEQLYLEHQQICNMGAAKIEQTLDECRNELVFLASVIKRQLQTYDFDFSRMIKNNRREPQEFADGIALRFSPFITIRFLAPDGDEIYVTNGLQALTTLSDVRNNPVFLQAVSKTINSTVPSQFPVKEIRASKLMTTFSIPFYNGSELNGLLFLEMDLKLFSRMLGNLAESIECHYLLFDGSGKIIAQGGQPAPGFTKTALKEYTTNLELFLQNPTFSFSQNEMTVNRQKFFMSMLPVKEYIAFKEPIPEGRWYLGIVRSESSLLAAFRTSKVIFFLVLISGLLLAVAGTIFISQKITTPLGDLTRTASRFAGGDLDSRVKIQSNDEIGELTGGFNKMASELKMLIKDRQVNEQLIAVGKFSTVLAHDLRNPIEGIKLLSNEMIKKINPKSPEYEHALAINQSVANLSNLINQSLDFARPIEAKLIKTDMIILVDQVLKDFQFKSVGLEKHYPQNLPLIKLDVVQFKRVVANLVQNALDACLSKKGDNKRIRITVRKIKTYVQLEISDTGTGISEQIKEKIFDPFYTTKPEGHGLGLALAQQIIKSHGASISFKSTLGKGTQFIIELPFSKGTENELK